MLKVVVFVVRKLLSRMLFRKVRVKVCLELVLFLINLFKVVLRVVLVEENCWRVCIIFWFN